MSFLNLAEERLVREFLSGSSDELILQFEKQIYTIARLILKDEAECELAVREVFERAMSEFGEAHGEKKLAHWFYKAAIDVASRHVQTEIHELDLPLEAVKLELITEEVDAAQVRDNTVKQAIQLLPYEYKIVFLLADALSLPIAELAEILSVTELEARAYLHRARLLLIRTVRRLGGLNRTISLPPISSSAPQKPSTLNA